MIRNQPDNVGESVRQRLLNLARERTEAFDLLLTRYALERLLYRIGRSEWREKFLLKGAMLYTLWCGAPHRSTRDMDLLASGQSDVAYLIEVFGALCDILVEDDGILFMRESVRAFEIGKESEYQGVRIQMTATLAGAVIHLQVDVAFGDAVVPAPEEVRYPTILDQTSPLVLAYPRYTVVSEKFQAMVMLGIANSRMKDFYDIWILAREFDFDGLLLSRAIAATFERRRTALPEGLPLALTDSFCHDLVKATQWNAFIRKNRLSPGKPLFPDVTAFLRDFFIPPVKAIRMGTEFDMVWPASGPWKLGRIS